MRDIIEIEKSLVPYAFNILLGDEWFELEVDYNKAGDLFTVALYQEGELIASEAVVMGQPLFADLYQPGTFPAVEIVPQDPNNVETAVTMENLGVTVFLTIDDEGDKEDGENL